MALDFRVGVPGEKCFGAHRVRPSEHPRLLGESCQLSLTVTMRTCVSPSPGDRERGPGPGASPPEDPGAGPGGVELMMSPQVALRQAGSQESSAGGLCRAGLARREAGWTASHWARITQAGPGPRRTQHAPPRARRPAPARSPPHPIPSRLAPRERVLTRENVCRGYDLEDRRRSRDPGGAPGAAARTRVAAGSVLPASKTDANELIDTGPGTRTGAATRLRP